MGHIILYCTFDKIYFCLLNDLLYESIVVFVLSFLFVWDIYLNILSKYHNIYISLLEICMVPLWAYVSNSRLYSLHENRIKTLLKKTQHFFFYSKSNKPLTPSTILSLRKGHLHYEAVKAREFIRFFLMFFFLTL
jgi:hypothetical protein